MNVETQGVYERLSAKFDSTSKLRKGGVELDYLTTEQVVSRLNDVLGYDGWDFSIREHGQDAKGIWVLGHLRVYGDEHGTSREQFGECQTNPGMVDGDARKGAASDALKKCASLLGVGLYLSHKEEAAEMAARTAPPARTSASAPLIAFAGSTTVERGAAFLERCKNELGIDSEGIEVLLGEKVSTRMRRTGEGLEQIYLVLKAKWAEAS